MGNFGNSGKVDPVSLLTVPRAFEDLWTKYDGFVVSHSLFSFFISF